MATSNWPSVGLHDSSITTHAAHVQADVESLHRKIGEGAHNVPSEVFLSFSFSVLELVEKILDQPNLYDMMALMKQIDNNTSVTLDLLKESGEIQNSLATAPRFPPLDQSPNIGSVDDVYVESNSALDEFHYAQEEDRNQAKYEAVASDCHSSNSDASGEMTNYAVDEKGGSPDTYGLDAFLKQRSETMEDVELSDSPATDAANPASPMPLPDGNGEPSHEGSSGTKTSKIDIPKHALLADPVHSKIYTPLKTETCEIRIVLIHPEPNSMYGISCELAVVSLDNMPEYRALSYTWGDAKDTLPILLDGHRFEVTRNLKRALGRLRNLGTETPIWIDAICINQVDMDERTQQVQLMSKIYANTSEVVVYLGEPPIPTGVTVAQQAINDEAWDKKLYTWTADDADSSRIEDITKYAQAYADTYPDLPDGRPSNPTLLAMCLMRLLAGDVHVKYMPLLKNVNIRTECFKAFQAIVEQSWWTRMWCVQEVILPSKVLAMYGRFRSPLQVYADAATNLSRHRSFCCNDFFPTDQEIPQYAYIDIFIRTVANIESGRAQYKQEDTTLLSLLELYHPKDATDSRDKVYGLLGLVKRWNGSKPIVPDYSISDAELFAKVAFNCIESSRSLYFLSFKAEKHGDQSSQHIDDLKRGLLYYTKRSSSSDVQLGYDWEDARKKGKPQPVPHTYASWAPDWGRINEKGFESIVADRIGRAQVFNVSGNYSSPVPKLVYTNSPVITSSPVLTVTAYRLGKIPDDFFDEVSYAWPFLVNPFVNINCKENFPLPLKPDKKLLRPYVAGGNRHDAICRAICGDTFFASASDATTPASDQTMFRRATSRDVESVKLWREWTRHITELHGVRELPLRKQFKSQEDYERVVEADRAIRSVGLLRRYFELESGYVGMAAHAQAEDEIMILMGARTPFAVRRLGKMNLEGVGMQDVYALVGECYLVGGMDGELVDDMKAKGMKPEELYLI